jgi:DNA-binding PadR family transcriptional regulator
MHPHFFDRCRAMGEHLYRHAARHRGFAFDSADGYPGHRSGGRGPGGFGAGRKLGAADLQLLILALLAEKPRHGYEIIKALDERSSGYYSPSPGMVYPALTYLEELGHASVEAAGAKKLYSLTEPGLAHLEENRAAVDALLEQLAWIGRKMEHVRRALSGDSGNAAEDFDAPHEGRHGHRHGHAGMHRVAAEVRQARRNLKSALIEKFDASPEEQLRIAAILERAAAEIKGK